MSFHSRLASRAPIGIYARFSAFWTPLAVAAPDLRELRAGSGLGGALHALRRVRIRNCDTGHQQASYQRQCLHTDLPVFASAVPATIKTKALLNPTSETLMSVIAVGKAAAKPVKVPRKPVAEVLKTA